jgi:UDP-N-acetylglucosamine 3-dehydrogenase
MKVGIIGCGGISPLHIKIYKKLKDTEVVGLCDISLDRAKNLASKFGIKNTYSNYWDMFEKESLDYVDICTPASTHSKIVADSATAVPSILVEKPMALTVPECDEMIKAVKKHGSKLCIGQNQIFSPHVMKAKSMVSSGDFDLFCFSTTQKESFEILKKLDLAPEWNVLPNQRGIIWEVCAHHAYLQLNFLPDIKEVYALGSKVKYSVYDDFSVLLRTSGDRFGLIELSWTSHETETVYELRDTTGRRLQIHWEYDQLFEPRIKPPYTTGNVIKNILADKKRLLDKWYSFGASYLKKKKLLPTFNLISSYVEAIKKDLPSPVSPEYGRNTVILLECIKKSLDEKKPVKVDLT